MPLRNASARLPIQVGGSGSNWLPAWVTDGRLGYDLGRCCSDRQRPWDHPDDDHVGVHLDAHRGRFFELPGF